MSAIPWENEGDRNYICMRHIVTDVVKEGLRKVFKQEWNTRYQATLGAWDDTNASGQQLFHFENTRRRPNKNLHQSKFQHGDTKQWDCSVLFDAILYSNSIGKASLNPAIKAEVDNLRNMRNDIMHADEAKLSDVDFQTFTIIVENAFKALGLPITNITQIRKERNLYKSFKVLPAKPTHEVVDRPEISNKIQQDLRKLRTDNDGKLTYFYISGNPGSGKSQLARQLCEEMFNGVNWQTETTFVMTLNAKDLDSLLYSYEKFCRQLNCDNNTLECMMTSTKPKDEKIKDLRLLIANRVKNWRRWWVIVDNVENLKIITPLLPQIGDEIWNNGQIILTIQNTTSIPSESSFTKHISISRGMKNQECHQLFHLLSGCDAEDQRLDEVAERLDHQPLAIAAAAVYFKAVRQENCSPQFSWEDYLEKLKKGKRKITEEQLFNTNPQYSFTMSAALLLAVENSAAENLIVNHAFHFFSVVSFEPLPLDIIVKYIQQIDDEYDKEEIYTAIKSCSLFLLTENEDCDVRLHRGVHEAIKLFTACELNKTKYFSDTVPSTERAEYDVSSRVNNVVKVLYFFKDRDNQLQLIPHLKAFNIAVKELFPEENSFISSIGLTFEHHKVFEIFHFFGQISRFYGEYRMALQFQNLNLQIWGESRMDLNISLVYRELGILHHRFGALDKAKGYHEQALEICEKQLGSNHVDVATSYNNLGEVYRGKGNLKQAELYHQRALKIREKQLGSSHVYVAMSCNNLGLVYHAKGDLKQAELHHQQALEIWEKELGSNHVDVATSYNNLGEVYRGKGDLKQAELYHTRALEIRQKQLGSSHVDVAMSCNNLGLVYHAKGDLKQAELHHQQALEIWEKQLGSNHVDVATSYNNLGEVYRGKGDLKQAELYHQRALEIREKQLGSSHVDVAMSCNNLGLVYHAKGDLKQAELHHQEALEIWEKQLGSNHVYVATSYNNLGEVYRGKSDLKQAELYHQRALEIREMQLGSSHVDVAMSCNNLGLVYHAKGDLKQAELHHQQALEIWEKQLGSNHVDVAKSYNNLGEVYRAKGDLKQAELHHQRALEIKEKQLGSNHVDVATSYNNLGEVYRAKGDLKQAELYHQRALEIWEKQLGSNHVDVATSYNNLGEVYRGKGDLKQAELCHQRALEIRENN